MTFGFHEISRRNVYAELLPLRQHASIILSTCYISTLTALAWRRS